MLVRYKKSLEKIAMGLLSFMPQEKDVKRLMETIQLYEQKEKWQLYLWKIEDEYVGIVGIKVKNNVAKIQHISVIPSYRGEGVGTEMIQQLLKSGQFEKIEANAETSNFIEKCLHSIDADNSK